MAGTGDTAWHEKLNLQHAVPGATEAAVSAEAAVAARQSLLRILPIVTMLSFLVPKNLSPHLKSGSCDPSKCSPCSLSLYRFQEPLAALGI